MMYTTYSSSSIISLRTYSAFNEYSYCSIEKCPSICCSCCCSFPINSCKLVVPTNPSLLYGLRQSSLIHCPPSRRFVLGSSDRYCCRTSNYDVGRCCCLECRQERVGGLVRKSCNEKCCTKEKRGIDVDKIKGRIGRPKHDFRSNALGDVEAMLSLLSEEIVEECVVHRENKRSSPWEVKAVNKLNIERFKDRKPNVVIEKLKDRKPNVVNERLKDRKLNVDFGYSEGDWKNYRLESGGRVQVRDGSNKRNEEKEGSSIDEDERLRRRESSSSYYSFSDSGDFGSDVEVEIKQDQFVGESSTSQKKESRKSGGVVISEATKQDWERYRDEKDQELRNSKRDDFKVGSSIQRDWRKKSEKKLTEDSEETDSINFRQSKLSQAQQSNSVIPSGSKKQLNHKEEQSTSAVKSFGQSGSHSQNDNSSSRHSNSSSQHEYLTQKRKENVESSSTTWRRSSQEDDLKMVGSVQETGCEYCKTSGRSTEKRKTQSNFQGHAETTEVSAKLTTSAENLSEIRQRKHDMSLSSHQSSIEEKSKQHDQIHMVTGQTSAERKSQHYRDIISTDAIHTQSSLRDIQQSEAQIHNLVERSKTTAENQSESRRWKEETGSSSLQTQAKEESKQHDEIYMGTSKVVARRKLHRYSGIMDTDASYSQSTFRSQQISEIRMKILEEKVASLVAAEEAKRLREESSDKVPKKVKSSIVPYAEIGESGVHSSDLEVNSHSGFDRRVYNEQTYLKSKVKSVEELVEKHKRIDETIVQSTLKTEVQALATGKYPGEASSSQPSVPIISQAGVKQFSGEEFRSGQLSMTSPPYHDVSWSQFREASSSSVKNDIGKTMEAGSGSSLKQPQTRTSSFYGSKIKSGEEYTHRDALVSAARMQESSTLIVGEFVEKMSLEASSSETSTEKKLEKLDFKDQDKKYMLKGSTESEFDKTSLQKQGSERPSQVASPDPKKEKAKKLDSKRSFADSETKGSSDHMWDVKDHFVQEVSEIESLEGAASESVAVVRTGKSLWSTVANICRLRWGSHSEKQKSPAEGKTSPSGSAGGELWFSGNEADEADDYGMKAEQLGLLQGTTADQLLLETTKSQREEDIIVNVDDKLSNVDADASSSSSVVQSNSLSGNTFVSENVNLNVPQLMSLPSPSVDLSIPSVSQLRRSNSFEHIDEPEKNEAPISPSEEQRDSGVDVRDTDVIGAGGIDVIGAGGTDVIDTEGTDAIGAEGTDVELRKKKLQRSKVVLQRYDEWEDAYRREREQRKVDEIFMREALSEAMKAADSWEVPVGAVLVQNGKIIARGYNLVEELRDSTAHAEMLCIREASNFLRTWRLSETTLYVTLEPCPMCAGAILQARISTLVWGAPNKLLGADGSWIRLFPDCVEGEQRSEETEKPAAPIHPFHPKMDIRRGILQEECADIMQQFFQLKRRKAKAKAKAKEKDTSSSDESGQPSCFPKPHHRSKLLHKMHNVFHPSKQQADQSS